MKNQQLTFAREYRGLTQTALAAKVPGLSQSNLSKFEKGLETLSEELINKIMNTLDFPVSFLDISIHPSSYSRHYRKKASIKVSDKNKIDIFVSFIAHCIDWMFESLDIPEFKFQCIDVESGVTPEEIARHVRRRFGLGNLPIDKICNLLEANGISIYFWDCKFNDFDGVSFITDAGNNIIVVNSTMSNDRIRFSLAHELGHVIMHNNPEFVVIESRNIEDEANRFASELLMPSAGIKNSLLNLKFSQLPILKSTWKTSMASIIRRAKTLNGIDDTKYTTLMTELSRRGWRLKEPYGVYIDMPTIIEQAYNVTKNDLNYTIGEIAKCNKLPIDIIKDIFEPSNNVIKIYPIR